LNPITENVDIFEKLLKLMYCAPIQKVLQDALDSDLPSPRDIFVIDRLDPGID